MPLFELYCQRCREAFMVFLPLSQAKEGVPCPCCGQRAFDPSLGRVPQEEARQGGVSCTLPERG